MPLTSDTIAQISFAARMHTAEAARLERKLSTVADAAGRKQIQEEVETHKVVARLAGDSKVISALNEIIDNNRLLAEAKRDPMAYAGKKGIEIPTGATIVLAQAAKGTGGHTGNQYGFTWGHSFFGFTTNGGTEFHCGDDVSGSGGTGSGGTGTGSGGTGGGGSPA